MSNLDAALAYAARGWRVHPLRINAAPILDEWQIHATTDPDVIRGWWDRHGNPGVGIATGKESGIWVLDVDTDRRRGKFGDETLAELTDAYGPLPDTYEVITGSGGRHLYFAWPTDGTEIRNDQSGRIGKDLDVRGEGGYVVAPPTAHRLYGTPFERELGSPDEVSDAPGWLVHMASHVEAPRSERPSVPADRNLPGDAWSATHTWDELLLGDQWVKLRSGPGGEDRWTRPGKDPREGPSATVGYKGSDVLKVFTSSLTHMGLYAEQTYTKFGYLAATRFDGDLSAAARWCRQQGYGEPRDTTTETEPPPAMPAWEEPWPEPTAPETQGELPPFPLESLPALTAEHAVAVADALQVPVDLCAMLAIGALSAAATGRAQVRLSPTWVEPVNLYLVVAMRSGAGKSPAEKAMAGWVRRWEAQRIAATKAVHEESTIKAELAAKRYQQAKGKSTIDDAEVLDAHRKAVQAADAVTPLPRLIVDDVTPQRLAGLLAEHHERLAVLSTEADLFDMLLKGKPGDRQPINVYLKAWSGDEARVDRKGSSESGPEALLLRNPLLTVSITVQPAVLAKIQADDEMVSRGFAARFMFSVPSDLMGARDQRKRFRSTGLATTEAYESAAMELANRLARWANPATLELDRDAASMLEDFLVEIEPQLATGAEMDRLAEWVAKLFASVGRYAGLLWLAEGGDVAEPIDGATMARALELGRYWMAHARSVIGSSSDRVWEQALAIMEWAAGERVETFTLRDVQRGVRRASLGLAGVADYVWPIAELIERGWLRAVDNPDWTSFVGVRGVESPKFTISPKVFGRPPSAVVVAVVRCPDKQRGSSLSLKEDISAPPEPSGQLSTLTTGDAGHVPESVDKSGFEDPLAAMLEAAEGPA